jgi:hypothetical protein
MDKIGAKETILIILIPFAVSIGFIILSKLILPESCNLFDNSSIEFACYGCDRNKNTVACASDPTVSVAQLTFGIGFLCFFLPPIIYVLKKRRTRVLERTKLSD